LNFHDFLRFGRLVVAVAGREDDAFDAQSHHFIEVGADHVGVGTVEESGVGRNAEAALDGLFDAFDSQIESAFAAYRHIVVLALAIEMHREGEVLRGRELMQALLEQERVGAQVDVLPARDEAVDDLDDLRVQQRLAARQRDHRHAALIDGREALFGAQQLFQNVRWVLNLAATCAGQVALKERLKHQHQWILLVPCQPLLEDVGCHGPHL